MRNRDRENRRRRIARAKARRAQEAQRRADAAIARDRAKVVALGRDVESCSARLVDAERRARIRYGSTGPTAAIAEALAALDVARFRLRKAIATGFEQP